MNTKSCLRAEEADLWDTSVYFRGIPLGGQALSSGSTSHLSAYDR